MSRVKTGIVTSTKMLQTVVVKIEGQIKHPLYKKPIKRTKNIKAHDKVGVKVGDKVTIKETKPFSKSVHFEILEVLK